VRRPPSRLLQRAEQHGAEQGGDLHDDEHQVARRLRPPDHLRAVDEGEGDDHVHARHREQDRHEQPGQIRKVGHRAHRVHQAPVGDAHDIHPQALAFADRRFAQPDEGRNRRHQEKSRSKGADPAHALEILRARLAQEHQHEARRKQSARIAERPAEAGNAPEFVTLTEEGQEARDEGFARRVGGIRHHDECESQPHLAGRDVVEQRRARDREQVTGEQNALFCARLVHDGAQ
jgi:hypothetical protein